MISMSLSTAARTLGTVYQGQDLVFHGCSTDSRSIKSGELFIAIRGERFNGHDFLEQARQQGAIAALVDTLVPVNLPVIKVSDTRRALGELAKCWRDNFSIPLVAITGSNGKTTVKEMLVAILSLKSGVLATKGNLNNDIGVPLTLFGIGNEHAYAIIEMGANHSGEIKWLSYITSPTVAVITQCAPAHLEGFGSVDGVANAKAEIYEGLEKEGTAIINADDNYADLWRSKVKGIHQLSFGIQHPADVSAQFHNKTGSDKAGNFILKTPADSIEVTLPLLGIHNIMNALAAAACATALNIELEIIKKGLEKVKPVKGRLEIKTGIKGSRIIDDTYNANPASLLAAIKVLKTFNGKHWLVLGDMGELGDEGEKLHTSAGEQARANNVDRLLTTGTLSQFASKSYGKNSEHFSSIDDLVSYLQSKISSDVTVLIKGSRSMQMERVVNKMEQKSQC